LQADHQANLYGGARTGVSTDAAVKWYTGKGATASKIVMGMPLYGRAFENTAGIGQPYSGVSDPSSRFLSTGCLKLHPQIGPGTIEPGIYSYKVLPCE
jgi:chitinase